MDAPGVHLTGGRSLRSLLVVWAALSLGYLLFLVLTPLGATGTIVVDDYASAVAPAVAGLACLRAAAFAFGQSRRAWLLLGSSALCWSAGGAIWTVYEVHLGQSVPFPSLADVGYLGFVPLAAAGLLLFPGSRAGTAAWLRRLLDGVIAAGALLFVSWSLVLGPAFEAGSGSVLAQSISLAYPAGDVLLATIALLALAAAQGERRVTMLLIGLGLLIIAVADSSFTWFILRGEYATGNLFDTGYVSGFLLIGVAGFRSIHPTAQQPAPPPALGRLALSLPYAPLLISLPFAVQLEFRGEDAGPFQFGIVLVVIVAVLVRQLLSMQVISALSRQLHDTVATVRQQEVALHHQVFHDPLTGLANRSLFADRLSQALTRTRRAGPVILLLADLDDFKTVNDTLGHPAGDELLVAVAQRLLTVVRSEDTVARLGGDEFAVLLEASEGLPDARLVAERIAGALLRPFHLSGTRTVIGASIGLAVATRSADGASLLRDADIAMYAAKADGRGGHVVFAAELAAANVGRLQLKGDLGEALDRGELSLQYQPIIDLATGRIDGVEALLRWMHPVRGHIPPDTFIAVAEASGAILPIGRWVLSEACAQAGRWQQSGAPPVHLTVNVSGRQIADPRLTSTLKSALAAAGLAPHLLTLEIPGSSLVDDDDDLTLSRLLAVHSLGVRLAVGGFGASQSAWSTLCEYPIHTLRIDRSFTAQLTQNSPGTAVIIRAILGIGADLGLNTIAEGVETDGQLAALRALGCSQAQGFLFARPADAETTGKLIRAGGCGSLNVVGPQRPQDATGRR